ncbi:hypothetical protein M0813_05702 [Anaeramoeba flamelloides]|uniref:GPI ethanolamine phosphate transferase 1 n=1 Tax=Anaeramoeba flamelloides TaxID=1746091 RepID=A0ABQ8XK02_9EUKA|nr:hypothetical protein M0813_05702 [Anaeramoeba flamelloides]
MIVTRTFIFFLILISIVFSNEKEEVKNEDPWVKEVINSIPMNERNKKVIERVYGYCTSLKIMHTSKVITENEYYSLLLTQQLKISKYLGVETPSVESLESLFEQTINKEVNTQFLCLFLNRLKKINYNFFFLSFSFLVPFLVVIFLRPFTISIRYLIFYSLSVTMIFIPKMLLNNEHSLKHAEEPKPQDNLFVQSTLGICGSLIFTFLWISRILLQDRESKNTRILDSAPIKQVTLPPLLISLVATIYLNSSILGLTTILLLLFWIISSKLTIFVKRIFVNFDSSIVRTIVGSSFVLLVACFLDSKDYYIGILAPFKIGMIVASIAILNVALLVGGSYYYSSMNFKIFCNLTFILLNVIIYLISNVSEKNLKLWNYTSLVFLLIWFIQHYVEIFYKKYTSLGSLIFSILIFFVALVIKSNPQLVVFIPSQKNTI